MYTLNRAFNRGWSFTVTVERGVKSYRVIPMVRQKYRVYVPVVFTVLALVFWLMFTTIRGKVFLGSSSFRIH